MKNKKVLVGIGITLIVIVNVFFFLFLKPKNKKTPSSLPVPFGVTTGSQKSPQDAGNVEQDLPSSSDQAGEDMVSGVLIGDGNPWKLIFDDAETGSPAATVELVFTDESRCDFGQGETSCDPMYFEVGTGIEVVGQKDGSKLIVSQIKRTRILAPQ